MAHNGSCLADKTAKAAVGRDLSLILPHRYQCLHNEVSRYQTEDEKLASLLGAKKNNEGWWVIPNRQVIINSSASYEKNSWGKRPRQLTGEQNQWQALKLHVLSVWMVGIIKSLVKKCELCLWNNCYHAKRHPSGIRKKGNCLGHKQQVDFRELLWQNRLRYIFELTDVFSGWLKAFPCCTNKAREVVKMMLK